jgi:MFS family permease
MSQPSQFDLLQERRFAPFFWTQFLGAGNDNIYKNALIIFVAFHAATLTSLDPNALVNLAGAVFIAPFVLFSATAGQLADKVEKSRLIRWIKLFEIAIMVVGLAGSNTRSCRNISRPTSSSAATASSRWGRSSRYFWARSLAASSLRSMATAR